MSRRKGCVADDGERGDQETFGEKQQELQDNREGQQDLVAVPMADDTAQVGGSQERPSVQCTVLSMQDNT